MLTFYDLISVCYSCSYEITIDNKSELFLSINVRAPLVNVENIISIFPEPFLAGWATIDLSPRLEIFIHKGANGSATAMTRLVIKNT